MHPCQENRNLPQFLCPYHKCLNQMRVDKADMSAEETRTNLSRPEKTREDQRRPEKTREDQSGLE